MSTVTKEGLAKIKAPTSSGTGLKLWYLKKKLAIPSNVASRRWRRKLGQRRVRPPS